MACYHPVPAWLSSTRTDNGKYKVLFSRPEAGINERRELYVPCGTCIGCRLEYARQWAVRCMHEAKLHERNCFVTLTYDDAHLPKNGSLVPRDFQLFMKRLRKRFGAGVRYFQCGEYGEINARPHYHALLFNFDFDDRVFAKGGQGGSARLFTSAVCDEVWGLGNCWIGDVSFESAGYVARYSLKKVRGPAAAAHYGERVPEYLRMSRRPGIGRGWFDKFGDDWYAKDELIVNGRKCKPPKYYDSAMEKRAPGVLCSVKRERVKAAVATGHELRVRGYVREEVKKATVAFLRRE